MDDFLFHNVQSPAFEGEVYPFITSTNVIHGYGIAAMAHVPNLLREQVYTALAALNETHPLCISACIAGFVAPSSYKLPRTVTQKSGIMFGTEEKSPLGHNRFDCHAPWDGYYEAIPCPDGHQRDSEESVRLNCERLHLFCPPDQHCVCRPCVPDMVLQMYPVQVRWRIPPVFRRPQSLFCSSLFPRFLPPSSLLLPPLTSLPKSVA